MKTALLLHCACTWRGPGCGRSGHGHAEGECYPMVLTLPWQHILSLREVGGVLLTDRFLNPHENRKNQSPGTGIQILGHCVFADITASRTCPPLLFHKGISYIAKSSLSQERTFWAKILFWEEMKGISNELAPRKGKRSPGGLLLSLVPWFSTCERTRGCEMQPLWGQTTLSQWL